MPATVNTIRPSQNYARLARLGKSGGSLEGHRRRLGRPRASRIPSFLFGSISAFTVPSTQTPSSRLSKSAPHHHHPVCSIVAHAQAS